MSAVPTRKGDVPKGKCDDCGAPGAEYTTCPYAEEINDEEIWLWLCDDCYQERCDDI